MVDNARGVIPYLAAEPDEFDAEVKRLRSGEINETSFTPWRLRRGVYGQRQPDVQMMRIKLPAGLGTADQFDALGVISERFAPLNRGHITTRENIQFHHIKLEETSDVMRILGDVGLSTREACGNTVRNVIADPMVGVDPSQAFDIIPYLVAYVRKFVRHPMTQAMPRKFKTAFSSGDHDPAVVGMHDLGFIARVENVNGIPTRGFKMVVGGGTSIMAKVAETLYEFVPVEDYLRVTEAVIRVFNNADELRQNKMMARIKVLIHRRGIEAVRGMVEDQLKEPWAQEGDFDPNKLMAMAKETPPEFTSITEEQIGNQPFQSWKQTNVFPQAQAGYSVAFAKVPQGDLSTSQFHAIADIARAYGSGTIGLGAEQNLALRWIPEGSVYAVWSALDAIGLGESGAHTITDITSCPGTDSCKMGITSAMGLNRAIHDSMSSWNGLLDDPLIKQLHLKASGCPNGCGRHHLANIGFQGASIKGADGEQVPAYDVFIGGNFENGNIRYAERVKSKVPAKHAPAAVKRILDFYQEQRDSGEEFNQFVERVGTGAFEAILAEFREVGSLNKDTLPFYMDWGKTVLYKLERGEGECAV
jgi:sulfite reductase beta subunit-like hemoprotein